MSRLASRAPRRSLIAALAVALIAGAAAFAVPRLADARDRSDAAATSALVAAIGLPSHAVEGCDRADGGIRCWTTRREGRAAVEGVPQALTDAGVADVTETCHESTDKRHAELCEIAGIFRGNQVFVSAIPRLLPQPPITFDGTTLVLFATVS